MRVLYIFFLSLLSTLSYAHTTSESQAYKFRVYLKDKGKTSFTIDNPHQFLSYNALERRKRQGVAVDNSDLPISKEYFTLVEKQSKGKIVSYSKWFSTFTVEVKDSLAIKQVEALPFVDSVKYVWQGLGYPCADLCNVSRPRLKDSNLLLPDSSVNTKYGASELQFKMHNAFQLYDAGYQGSGIVVGVIDAGFTNFDVIPSFETVNLSGYKDFVPDGSIFSSHEHGTKVLSTMATNQPGIMMGSAPGASYWLFRSEDVGSEYPVEEDYWVRAIEYADSVGVDLVNTSLGYSKFDDTSLNYTHKDLTGAVSIMSLAADKAFSKGLLIVSSVGNEGSSKWRKSTPPSDAKHILAVGAVGVDSVIASFSSRGYMADGRIKPDFVSVGSATATIAQDGQIDYTNGTSFASPFLAGLITSLWSINPDMHRTLLVDILKQSSDRYSNPDSIYGYGIIDFGIAMKKVFKTLPVYSKKVKDEGWLIEPDSLGMYSINVSSPAFYGEAYEVRLLDESGRLLSKHIVEDNAMVLIQIPDCVKNDNEYIHFVINEPYKYRTYRVKL